MKEFKKWLVFETIKKYNITTNTLENWIKHCPDILQSNGYIDESILQTFINDYDKLSKRANKNGKTPSIVTGKQIGRAHV